MNRFSIRPATESDIPVLLSLIKQLAEYEKLSHAVVATENDLRRSLFGPRPVAEALIGESGGQPVAFAVFFHNFSTFLARPGLYLEDLFVVPSCRGGGFGKLMLAYLAKIAIERNCGRFEWSVLDWNESAINFYKKLGAVPMDDWTVFRLEGDALKKLAGE
ncbi:MAG: GNAT family N-acetyltransferase [candidate division Zixibacteria bacterium]|nr:GNAT family N-acetyltransferase [candidate division Zixibacteria bacterium]